MNLSKAKTSSLLNRQQDFRVTNYKQRFLQIRIEWRIFANFDCLIITVNLFFRVPINIEKRRRNFLRGAASLVHQKQQASGNQVHES